MVKILTTTKLIIFFAIFTVLYPFLAFNLYTVMGQEATYTGELTQFKLQEAEIYITDYDVENITKDYTTYDFELEYHYQVMWVPPPSPSFLFRRQHLIFPFYWFQLGVYTEEQILANWDPKYNWSHIIISVGNSDQVHVFWVPHPDNDTLQESFDAGVVTMMMGRGYEEMQEANMWTYIGRYINFASSMLFGGTEKYPIPVFINVINWCLMAVGMATILLYVRGI